MLIYVDLGATSKQKISKKVLLVMSRTQMPAFIKQSHQP